MYKFYMLVTNFKIISGPSRRDGWIVRVRIIAGRVPRGLYAIWDPFFGCVAQKCEGFSKMLDSGLPIITSKGIIRA